MALAPIIVFVYNRPWHTQQTIEALQKNELATESELFIFADGPKANATEEQKEKIRQVREYIHKTSGFKSVTICEKETNCGLANSVIAGVTEIINKFGKTIVVEDDLLTSKYFLRFMNEALDFYEQDKRIYMIGGFNLDFKFPHTYLDDVFIVHRSCSWGWSTWKNRWMTADWAVSDYSSFANDKTQIERFCRGGNDMFPMLQNQMDGKLDSWAIRWDYCMYKHDAYCLWPKYSMVKNIGFDGSGIHCGENDYIENSYFSCQTSYKIKLVRNISANTKLEKLFKDLCSSNHGASVAAKIKKFIINVMNSIKGML